MKKDKKMGDVKLFDTKKVRRHYDTVKEIWYFSVIDVIEILTDALIPKRYWSDLKKKLAGEGSEVYEKIARLKLPKFLKLRKSACLTQFSPGT